MVQGARKGISAADVVQSCDITFCCVADSFALKEVFKVSARYSYNGEAIFVDAVKKSNLFLTI